jgi:hypothetical protein
MTYGAHIIMAMPTMPTMPTMPSHSFAPPQALANYVKEKANILRKLEELPRPPVVLGKTLGEISQWQPGL